MHNGKLPDGKWLRISNLPLGTTEQELSDHFKAHGFEIGPERFSVKDITRHNAGAILSFPDALLCDLLDWVVNGEFKGSTISFRLWEQRPRS